MDSQVEETSAKEVIEVCDMPTISTTPANHCVETDGQYDDLVFSPTELPVYLAMKGDDDGACCHRRPPCGWLWLWILIAFILGASIGILLGFFTVTIQKDKDLATVDMMTTSSNPTTSLGSGMPTTAPSITTAAVSTVSSSFNTSAQPGQCAFSVVEANLGLSDTNSRLVYSRELVDYPSNTSFERKTGVFTPASESKYTLYFYSLDVYSSSRTLNVSIRTDPPLSDTWSIDYYNWQVTYNSHADGEYHQVGRESIRGGQPQVKMGAFYSDGHPHDSFNSFNGWSGFSISTSVRPYAIFNLVRRSGQSELGKIGFHRALANAGDNLPSTRDQKPDEVTNEYPVPFDGLYYFSYSFGTLPNKGAEVRLYVNEQPFCSLVSLASNRNGSTVVSRSLMLYLYRGNKVTIRLVSGEVHSSPEGEEVSLLGFWYRPWSGIQHAWSVHTTQPVVTTLSNLNPTIFYSVWANAGALWNEQTNRATIAVSGIYYVQTNACKTRGKTLYVHIRVNRRTVASAHMNDNVVQLDGHHSVTRGQVLQLQAGDEVDVLIRGTSHSQIFPLTSFTGFLVYPTP